MFKHALTKKLAELVTIGLIVLPGHLLSTVQELSAGTVDHPTASRPYITLRWVRQALENSGLDFHLAINQQGDLEITLEGVKAWAQVDPATRKLAFFILTEIPRGAPPSRVLGAVGFLNSLGSGLRHTLAAGRTLKTTYEIPWNAISSEFDVVGEYVEFHMRYAKDFEKAAAFLGGGSIQ